MQEEVSSNYGNSFTTATSPLSGIHKRKLEVSTDGDQPTTKEIKLDLNVAVNETEGESESKEVEDGASVKESICEEQPKPFCKTKSMLETEELVKQIEEEERLLQEEQDKKDRHLALNLQPKQCPLCLDDIDIDFMHTLTKCNHELCRECANKYATGKIAERSFPIRCPVYPCKQELVDADLELLLDKISFEMYTNNSLAAVIEKDPVLFSCCPTPDCSYVFFKAHNDSSDFGCPLCKKRYCLACKVDYHSGSTCEQYQAWSVANGTADDLFTDFVVGHKFKKCPGCQRWVEKDEGCNHMTCRCGYEFCYRCGGKFGSCLCMQGENSEDEDEEDY